MKKVVISLLTGLLIGALTRFVGVANVVAPAEDNGRENGYYMYCLDKAKPVWVELDKVEKGEKFLYLFIPKNNKVIKLVKIN
ncbi:hypothetical protein HYH65_04475 [Clostridium botulinum]|uniref:Uncharacterized protein n=1 Tax=Clostridium botulinum (strain Langeland / NCTC 10281 / Type F) TaxID=441772 RepID=A7GD09_CLOBL|nr:hypothetical protein [Clostridium botulinum]ABS40491.1 hypothetical protein CLI_1404 [Clostridium botulinum F str. Langeland]ADF99122.1 hypothetical protein CBF_1379 [Clostridium botulinum F str. 230613]KKM43320.1 hypothetical protein VT72_06660 [Clostridium botulinum]MBY6791163.1 hypothetical protein [Clostridium botulinum]MBY6936394.1 hypothetical protein [Clostridium botulinum]